MLAAVYWARAPRVVLPDRALCLPTFCHSLLTVNKSSSSYQGSTVALGVLLLHGVSYEKTFLLCSLPHTGPRAPRVVLPDRALCLPTFCHSL